MNFSLIAAMKKNYCEIVIESMFEKKSVERKKKKTLMMMMMVKH